jgi:hypothetical protein
MVHAEYTAEVTQDRQLKLLEDARELRLKPGDRVHVTVETNMEESEAATSANDRLIAVLREIEEHQRNQQPTDGADSLRLLHEARTGAMYDRDAAD